MVLDGETPNGGFRLDWPFGWGLLLIGDGASQELPSIRRGVAVTATGSVIAVGVRHAQDVEPGSAIHEFHVSVEVRVGQPADRSHCFDCLIDVPSGRITLGDADREEEVDVGPGRWRVQVALEPEDLPEHVDVWITKAT